MTGQIFLVSNDQHAVIIIKSYVAMLRKECVVLNTADELFTALKQSTPELIIIDFVLNDVNGGALCHQLKSHPDHREMPVALLTEYLSMGRLAVKFGCTDIITQPLDFEQFATVIANLNRYEMHK